MKSFLLDLFVGPGWTDYSYGSNAIRTQKNNVLAVWRNQRDATFGIERILRLGLAVSAFIFPALYIRHVSGKSGMLRRKLTIEAYVIAKLFLPLFVLAVSFDSFWPIQILVGYMALETILYNLSLLFLSDVFVEPISFKRSYISALINFFEIIFDFAVLYKSVGLIDGAHSTLDAIYFSAVTAFTIGYGDMKPVGEFGKVLVIVHATFSLVLVTLVLARLVSALDTNNVRSQMAGRTKSDEKPGAVAR